MQLLFITTRLVVYPPGIAVRSSAPPITLKFQFIHHVNNNVFFQFSLSLIRYDVEQTHPSRDHKRSVKPRLPTLVFHSFRCPEIFAIKLIVPIKLEPNRAGHA